MNRRKTVAIVAIAAVAAAGIIATLAFMYPVQDGSTTLEGLEREQQEETIPGSQPADDAAANSTNSEGESDNEAEEED